LYHPCSDASASSLPQESHVVVLPRAAYSHSDSLAQSRNTVPGARCVAAQSELPIKIVLASNKPTAVRLIDVRALRIALALAQPVAFEARRDHL
jgi:hypothetical protein